MQDNRHYLKIKIKHLAAEARIIRQEERKFHGMDKWALQHHRKTVVRDAARQAQMAYAVIRGRSLERCFRGYDPDFIKGERDREAIIRMVKKYGSPEQQANAEKLVKEWFQ